MDRKLLDYLPPVLREVIEMQAINEANEPEVARAWDALALVLANQFLETADARGVAVWEKELKLLPKDTDLLTERKARIKAKWNVKLPYSFSWLKNWLTNLYGQDGHEENVENYTLNIRLHYDLLEDSDSRTAEVIETLRSTIPANILLCTTNKYQVVQLKNRLTSDLGRLFICVWANNFSRGPVRFNGRQLMDGTVLFNQRDIPGPALVKVTIGASAVNTTWECNFGHGPVRFNGRRLMDGTVCFNQWETPCPALSKVTIGVRAVNRLSVSANVPGAWKLNGTHRLDGMKKLDANI